MSLRVRPLSRATFLMCCAFLVVAGAASQETAKRFENTLHQLAAMIASGAEARLCVALRVEDSGLGDGKGTSTDMASALAEELRAELSREFAGAPSFRLLWFGPQEDLPGGDPAPARSDAATLSRCAALGGNLLLIVEESSYSSGGGMVTDGEARLLDVATGRVLARDVTWIVVSSTGARSVFVNGERIR